MGLTPAAVDKELLELMKSAGFNEVDIGVESVCDPVLKSLSKDFKVADVLNTASLLKEKKMPATWFIMLGAPEETRETVSMTLNSVSKIISKWDLVFVSTGIRIYNGSSFAKEIVKQTKDRSDDNFMHPVKIEPPGISLEDIHQITRRFSFCHPNFYFYDREHFTPAWQLIFSNFLLKIFRSRQPVWRLLILIKKSELVLGISLAKRLLYDLKAALPGFKSVRAKGFTLVSIIPKTS